MNIITYQSAKAWPDKHWLAHVDLGRDCYASFFAATEEAAIKKANDWYKSERERWARIDTSVADEPVNDELKPVVKRGAHLVGMVWMINPQAEKDQRKIRIPAEEQKLWEGRGYRKGGARSLV